MNVVNLEGTVASDPEVKVLGDDRRLCTFRLAVMRPCGSGADVIRVVVSDGEADACAGFVCAGKPVAVTGRLRSRTWDENGERRSAIEVVAYSVGPLATAA